MEDSEIVDLYWDRAESAISETQRKYGKYCHYIAYNILNSEQDAEECVNDTYIKAWECIPPHRPNMLKTFLGKLTRNIAINRYIHENAKKRSRKSEVILDELDEFIADPKSENSFLDEMAFKDALNGFLGSLPEFKRNIFVKRYWYMCSINDIAEEYYIDKNNVKTILFRTRKQFRIHLEKEGIKV